MDPQSTSELDSSSISSSVRRVARIPVVFDQDEFTSMHAFSRSGSTARSWIRTIASTFSLVGSSLRMSLNDPDGKEAERTDLGSHGLGEQNKNLNLSLPLFCLGTIPKETLKDDNLHPGLDKDVPAGTLENQHPC